MNTYYTSLKSHFENLPEVRDQVWTDDRIPDALCGDIQSDNAYLVLKKRYLVQQFLMLLHALYWGRNAWQQGVSLLHE
jgi:hypothetical protein